jgi:DNA-binding IscR family transcriptional regulator
MYKHKTFDKDIEIMKEYIQENSNEDGVVVSIDTIKEKTNVNQAYASAILNGLKEVPGIESKRGFGKQTKFKFVTPKIVQTVIMDKKYKNLTEDEAAYAMKVLEEKGIHNQETMMSIINILAYLGAKENFISKYMDTLSDMLVMKHNQIRVYINVIETSNLLVANDGFIRLTLSDYSSNLIITSKKKTPEAVKPQVQEESKPVNNIVAENPKPADSVDVGKLVKDTFNTISEGLGIEPEPEKSVIEDLKQSMTNMSGIIDQFQGYLKETVSSLGQSGLKEQLQAQVKENQSHLNEISNLKTAIALKDNQLTEGKNATDRIIGENTRLKDDIREKSNEINLLKKTVKAYKDSSDNLFTAMQGRFELLLADINTTITAYTSKPAYKITPSDSARVQKQVLDAITAAMDDLIKSDTNITEYNDKD